MTSNSPPNCKGRSQELRVRSWELGEGGVVGGPGCSGVLDPGVAGCWTRVWRGAGPAAHYAHRRPSMQSSGTIASPY